MLPTRAVRNRALVVHPSAAAAASSEALAAEASLGAFVASGRYWEAADRLDPTGLAAIDALWLAAARPALAQAV